VKKLKGRDQLEEPHVDRRILKWLLRMWMGEVWYGFYLVQDIDKWWDLVNTVMNFQ
jgi:hypothetical protein